MDKNFLNKLEKQHESGEYRKIIDAILSLPEHAIDYDLSGHLARAYNNANEYDKAIETLMRVQEQGQNDARWLFRLGYAYFYQNKKEEALQAFTKCKELNPDEKNIDLFLSMARSLGETADNERRAEQEYWELHLEKVMMPVPGKRWKNDLSPAFFLDISGSGTGKIYEFAFSPFEDDSEKLNALNRLIERKGFEANGCGCENYFRDYIVVNAPELSLKIVGDSDVDTCRLIVKSKKEYYVLLRIVSKAVRELYVCYPKAKLPEDFAYLKDMFSDDYYPKKLVERVKQCLQKIVAFIESGRHTYEEIQQKLDEATEKINDLQEKFDKQESEIETMARESIADTISGILAFFNIDIDVETALRERDW